MGDLEGEVKRDRRKDAAPFGKRSESQ